MARLPVFALLATMMLLGAQVSYLTGRSDQTSPVTFNKDVLPVLQKNCQDCHRPGEAAPMSFLTYESTRPWAKAIKTAVVSRQMPPWFADPHFGEFRNARTLTETDIKTFTAWADGGALEGTAADKPAPREWTDGWKTKPDIIVSIPQPQYIGAKGAGEIKEFFIPNPFTKDTWVSSIEIRPSEPSVVHHVILQIKDPVREAALRSALGPAGVLASNMRVADRPQQGQGAYSDLFSKFQELKTGEGSFMTMEAVYAPGTTPQDFGFMDSAKLIHAGGQLRIEVHYTPNGKDKVDQTRVGFTLAKAPPQHSFVLMAPEHLVDPRIPITAGDSNWETIGEITFKQDAKLVWFMPHMHLRGKDMTFQLLFPDGRTQTVLKANFNFNWQLGYEVKDPILINKGTRMLVIAHHDNSANKATNPDPTENVKWGDLTGQEMMLPWFGVVVDRDLEPGKIASYHPRDLIVDDTLRALDQLVSSGFEVR
jgi:hypothetical protein